MLRARLVGPRCASPRAAGADQALVFQATRTSTPYTLTDDPRMPPSRPDWSQMNKEEHLLQLTSQNPVWPCSACLSTRLLKREEKGTSRL